MDLFGGTTPLQGENVAIKNNKIVAIISDGIVSYQTTSRIRVGKHISDINALTDSDVQTSKKCGLRRSPPL